MTLSRGLNCTLPRSLLPSSVSVKFTLPWITESFILKFIDHLKYCRGRADEFRLTYRMPHLDEALHRRSNTVFERLVLSMRPKTA